MTWRMWWKKNWNVRIRVKVIKCAILVNGSEIALLPVKLIDISVF